MPDVLVATDAAWVLEEIDAVVPGPDTTLRSVRAGIDVLPAVQKQVPDLLIIDLQIGNMGGMATCLNLRLEESAGRLPHVPVLMLLDRQADIFLAKRSQCEGWLVKPLDAIRIRKAVRSLLAGGEHRDLAAPPEPATVPATGNDLPVG